MGAAVGSPDGPDQTVEAVGGGKPGALAAGQTLGKYRLDRVLGSGGMGVVWAAHDPDLERAVAIKVLRYENAAVELRRRLLREARAMARLKHPNVLTVYEVDSEGDRDFIAMELVDGMSLDRWAAGQPARDEIWHALVAAGRGLAAAHRAGLVHRDFKPHNVLRSDDGRVLVTDFGLARGHGEEATAGIALETTLPLAQASGLEATVDALPSPSGSGRSAEVQLTQTGAVVGTPAYMAPEQFLGAAPDPRTDQFAYCVTAWQLFVGERPFRGTTIEELRRAASGGVAGVKAKLPGAIRAVLARGLAPDPADRWPDMAGLLAALERARSRPQRRRRLGFALAIAVLGVALVAKLGHQATLAESVCEIAPEDELAKAWSPALRAGLAQQFGNSQAVQYIAGELDGFAVQWLDDYRTACASRRSTKTFAKLGCLLGERDEVAGITALVPTVPVSVLEDVQMGGVLPRPQACDGDAPVTPPTLPDDPARRARIEALRPKLLAARFAPPEQEVAAMPGLVGEAEAIGWDPVIAEAHQAYGFAAQRAGRRWELARDHFKLANQLARRSHHYHLEANTWASGLLVGEIEAATDPADNSEAADLFAQARIAVQNAGDDPVYLARIIDLEGAVAGSRGRFDEALAKHDQASAMALSVRDWAGAMQFAIDAAFVLARRNRPGDLAAAWDRLVAAERVATQGKLSNNSRRSVVDALWQIAQLRGDLAAAHAWADREPPPTPPPGAVAISGRVVGTDGHGVAGATVVAWRGILEGDATRAYARSRFEGAIATTAGDGGFTLRGVIGGGIIAELGDRRSRPRVIGDGAIALELEPTRAVAGTVVADGTIPAGIAAVAHYSLGDMLAWRCVAAAGPAHDYRLAGLPGGTATLGLDARLDPNRPIRKLELGPVRGGAELRWPVGPSIDAIVRGGSTNLAIVYVLRGRQVATTHEELDQLFAHAKEGTMHPALVIGVGDQTIEGVKQYARGDRHAIFLDNAPGEVTVCATELAPSAEATCETIELSALSSEPGDAGAPRPVVPVVLER